MDERELRSIKQKAERQLLSIPGVHSVGLGGKEKGGRLTGEVCIKIYVVKKRNLSDVPPAERIPTEIDGIKTDIVEYPVSKILQTPGGSPPAATDNGDTERYRPLRGGIAINREGQGTGTLGCFATVTGNPNQVLGITNHHVLYSNCSDTSNQEAVGQPEETTSCTDCCSSIIGNVLTSVCSPDLDIALIQLSPGQQWLAEILQEGLVTGGGAPTSADAATHTYWLTKRGQRTALTGGVLDAVDASGTVYKSDGVTVFRNYQHALNIIANPDPAHPAAPVVFAAPGDSGSAVLHEGTGKVVGILFGAGGPNANAVQVDELYAQFHSLLPPAQQVQLEIAAATSANNVQTVPGAHYSTVDPLPSHIPSLERDLRQTETGSWYLDLYLRHVKEIRQLINNNRRVATVWHRSGGAEFFQALVQVFRVPGTRVPSAVQGRPIRDCVDEVSQMLCRYGSARLRSDLLTVQSSLSFVAGCTYSEILEHVENLSRTTSLGAVS
jgi:hypothetical protein